MSATTTANPVATARAAAADAVRAAIERDGREQKDIAAAARMSGAQLTRLKTGDRLLRPDAARQLEHAMPHIEDGELVDLAWELSDAILAARYGSAIPGYLWSLLAGWPNPSSLPALVGADAA